eukprot:SAG22_NODE_95_length_20791_cov_40.318514_6_plen_74_part_00
MVEQIVAHTYDEDGNPADYLVRWGGIEDTSWVPVERRNPVLNCAHDTILNRHKDSPGVMRLPLTKPGGYIWIQ